MSCRALLKFCIPLAFVGVVACGEDEKDDAVDTTPYYEGKAITLKVGFAAGGAYDKYARLHAQFWPNFIPGAPSITVENVTAAGSAALANAMYETEPKDGTVVGAIGSQQALVRTACGPSVEQSFVPNEFQWLGSVTHATNVCAVMNHVNADTFDEMMAAGPLKFGATGPGSGTYDVIALIKGLLSASDIEIVDGYTGTSQIRTALNAGEVDGVCTNWDSMQTTFGALLAGDSSSGSLKQLVIVFYTGSSTQRSAEPALANASLIDEVFDSQAARDTFRLWASSVDYDRPLILPPGTDVRAVTVLRTAFEQMVSDPAYLAEAEAQGLSVDGPASGAELQAAIQTMVSMPQTSKDQLQFLCQ